MFCLLIRPACASVLIGSGDVNVQSGERATLTLQTQAGRYEGAGTVVFFNAAGVALVGEGFYAAEGTHTTDIGILCGVDQPSMNVVRYEIYNDTPFGFSATGSVSRGRDAEIARDADNGGGSANDALEAGGGRTVFGALAAVDSNNPEDGKYWNVHLEQGETLRTSGWAISGNSSSGANLVIEIQDLNNGQWYGIDTVAAYGKSSFSGGVFSAPSAGNYALRARCTTTRICKFMIQMNISGRSLSPCYDGDCSKSMDQGANNLPVNVANGREQSEFGGDISVANPVGPNVNFGRRWLEVLALQRVGSPGLARGWMHSYDVRVLGDNSYNVHVQFASGGMESWTATLDANGQPTGELKPPAGAPYRVQGVLNPIQTNPAQKDPDAADYLVEKKWSSLELIWDDGSTWNFKPADLRYSYQLDRQTNPTGQYLQFAYGASNGELQTIKNQSGTTLLTLNYNGDLLANVTDIYGRRVAYAWAQPAGLPKVVLTGVSTIHAASSTNAPPTYQQYQYWPYAAEANKPLLKTIVTRSPNGGNGVTTAYNTYDNAARVDSTTDGNGNVHQYSYLAGETFIAVKNASGQTVQVWTQYFDAQGRDRGHADASLNRWAIYYDDGNNPLKATRMTDPMGRTATTTYDVYGHVTSTASPRGVKQISTWNYSNWSLGRMVQSSVQDANAVAYAPTTYSYFEPSGLIQSVVGSHPEAGGRTVTSQFTYDSYGNPLTVTQPGENTATRTTTFDYLQDGTYSQPMFVGHPLAMTDALGHTTHLRYDARGNAISSTDAAGATTGMTYDVADAPTSVIYPASGQTGSGNGRTDTTYSYDGGPLLTQITRDEAGAIVRTLNQTYGNEGELKAQSGDQTNQSTTYDAMYRTIAFQDGSGNATNYFYDGNGRATATAYPGADFTTGANMERTTAFDNSGLPLQSVDGRGVVSNMAYTPDGLPESVSYPASSGENVSLTYNSFGQPIGRADANGEEIYGYNDRGLMMSQSTRYRNAAGALMNPFVQTQHFYASGALQQLATSLGNQNYAYDAVGNLSALSDPDSSVTNWNYDVRDQLQSQSLSTGTTTAITHNVLGQLTSQRNANANNITLSSWGHPTDATQKQLYNALGQLTRNTAFSTPTYDWGGTTTYAYDNRAQLAQESSSRGAGYTHNFGYSGAANPTSWKGQTRTFNANNQETTGNAFLYDGAGNTTQMPNANLATPAVAAPTQKLIYNAQGQLAELRDAANVTIATYVYRGDGKRAWKELANGTRSYFYYSGEQLTASTNGNDASSLQLWGADGLVGTRNVNAGVTTKLYFLYDTQGNLAQSVDAANGNVVSQSAVTAWGEPLRDAAGNATGGGYGLKFGYVRDGESGFYLCTLRYYDPSAGRWITRDPIGYNGGSNLYGYVDNDPLSGIDPSGLATDPQSGSKNIRIVFDAFIPTAAVAALGINNPLFGTGQGDNRRFSSNDGGKFRVSHTIILNPMTGNFTSWEQIGTSVVKGTLFGAVKSWARKGTNQSSLQTYVNKDKCNGGWNVHIEGNSRNGFSIGSTSPGITYRIQFHVSPSGEISGHIGSIDAYPAYELWRYLPGRAPTLVYGQLPGKFGTVLNLFPSPGGMPRK